LIKKEKVATLNALSKLALGIAGKRINVFECKNDELGYTDKKGDIYLNFNHDITENLTNEEKIMFVRGVFTHEMLHILITNFKLYFQAIDLMKIKLNSDRKLELFSSTLNICEDSAIEYFAPNFFNKDFLRAIEFTRAVMYKESCPIDYMETPLNQILQAMVYFKIFGFSKGHFTFPEAEAAFKEMLPLLVEVTHEPTQKRRIELSTQIFEIALTLYDESEEFYIPSYVISNNGTGEGTDSLDADVTNSNSSIEKRRATVLKKLEAKSSNNNDESKSPESPETSKLSPVGDSKSDDEQEVKEADKNAHNENSELSDDSKDDSKDNSQKDTGEKSDENSKEDEELLAEMAKEAEDESSLSPEEIAKVKEETKKNVQKEESEQKANDEKDETCFDFPISGGYLNACDDCHLENRMIFQTPSTEEMAAQYYEAIEPYLPQINSVSNQLRRILKNKRNERVYSQSGKIDLDRLHCGRRTSRVFTKNKIANETDMSVVVAVDISGSMWDKIAKTKVMVATLAEVFGKLDIPLYVFGFTTTNNRSGYENPLHFNYINWSNRPENRIVMYDRIVDLYNNFDGYSIRYAAELLKKRNSTDKLLIVLSDGQPYCSHYQRIAKHTSMDFPEYSVKSSTYNELTLKTLEVGIRDTKSAIAEASKNTKVFGILLGNNVTPEIHRMMYGYNFVHCKEIDDLFPALSKILSNFFKGE
jgi:hypothetical protein